MKSGQFNTSKSTIRGSREKEKTQKTNWDRVVYLTLLSVGVIAISYYLINRNFFVIGDGRVTANELQVLSPSDIRFQEIFVQAGDTVQQSDTLFRFSFIEWQQSMDSLETIKRSLRDARLELSDIQDDLRIKANELERNTQQIEYYESRISQIKREVQLGVATVSELKSVEDRVMNLKGELSLIREQQQLLFNKRNRLQRKISSPYGDDGSDIPLNAGSMQHIYTSPVSGIVTALYKNETELGLRSERIMALLSEQSQLKIKAIFEQKAGKYLSIGDHMSITFDNGVKSRGVITDIYAAEALIDRPTGSQSELEFSVQIVAELKPEDPVELNQWKSYNKMGVTVKKTIF
jgi:multidrug resistance efflux pump